MQCTKAMRPPSYRGRRPRQPSVRRLWTWCLIQTAVGLPLQESRHDQVYTLMLAERIRLARSKRTLHVSESPSKSSKWSMEMLLL